MLNVTKTYLPSFDVYIAHLKRAWDKGWITNNGELVQELEQKLKEYLGVRHLFFCTNGTVVLQMALKALKITGEVITTPFSYVATTNAILWEGCTPVFVDIEPDTFCIDPFKIEAAITPNTQAILATHVYGLPCNIELIEQIAQKYQLKIIYDGAHAFGATYGGKSLLSYGDISTCSFHATKLFHTVEGGCIICEDDDLANQIMLYRQFGHVYDDYHTVGINAKNSEFHAAMGLSVLPEIDDLIAQRREIFNRYSEALANTNVRIIDPNVNDGAWNFAYFPVVFPSEAEMFKTKDILAAQGYFTRRYFFPSLNNLPYLSGAACPVSEDVSSRVLCLPFFPGLASADIDNITRVFNHQVVA